ncbi:unnamed protein product [Kuraishia capsulata CBS 1993]|uniref:Nucleolar pre-ribosomal-associated protein 1 C-terminal domain-containing protein n=1 Tax=Kuraishia capsulata CBS 1993 TaxID=1382522 RepID=W6MUL2_9ASCO|nr:uncharacterized protein KUCA_T00005360001 [Kuraishia capsulata CBS 1993]CDK29372.1 unnamed protein product [Kuraishia capsulata CBS 1993]
MSKYSSANVQLVEDVESSIQASDLVRLAELLTDHNLIQLAQAWQSFSTANQHRKLRDCTLALTKIIEIPELASQAKVLLTEILTNHNRALHRCLDSHRPQVANPALDLLAAAARFKNGALCDLVVGIDLKNVALAPSKTELSDPQYLQDFASTTRAHFGALFIDILRFSRPTQRQDFILAQNKAIGIWFKYIDTHTTSELIRQTLEVYGAKVLGEHAYRKTAKAKLIPASVLKKLVDLFALKDVRDDVLGFMITLTTDKSLGLVYEEPLSQQPLTIGSQDFFVNNKHIFTLLTDLKPWVDEYQSRLVLKILHTLPELIPVYNFRMTQVIGPHEPKLSSFWVGYSLFLLGLISSDCHVPVFSSLDSLSSAESTLELVLPSQLSKTVVAKSLVHESKLIRQIVANLFLASFNRFTQIISNLGSSRADLAVSKTLTDLFFAKLPNVSVVVGALNDAPNDSILFLALSKVLQNYLETFPVSVTANYLDSLISKESSNGLDIAILNTHLQIQKMSAGSIKWWNRQGGASSLFTTLCKLPVTLGESLLPKVANVLDEMCRSTSIFTDRKTDEHIWGNQAYALCHSLYVFAVHFKSEPDAETLLQNVYSLLDETVSRCARAPYGYIDKAAKIAPTAHLSAFVVALCEQLKFVSDPRASLWLVLFLRELALANEPVQEAELEISVPEAYKPLLDFQDFEKNSEAYRALFAHESVWDLLISAPLKTLSDALPNIITSIEAAGILSRIKFSLKGSPTKVELDCIESLFTRLENFASSNPDDFRADAQKFWKSFYLSSTNCPSAEVQISRFTVEMLYELSQSLKLDLAEFAAHVVLLISTLTESDSTQTKQVLANSVWALDNQSLLKVSNVTEPVVSHAILMTLVDRQTLIPFSLFRSLSGDVRLRSQLVRFLQIEDYHDLEKYFKSCIFTETEIALELVIFYPNLAQIVSDTFKIEKSKFETLFSSRAGVRLMDLVESQLDSAEFTEFVHVQGLQRVNEKHFEVLNVLLVPLSRTISKDEKADVMSALAAIPRFNNVASQVFSREYLEFIMSIMDQSDSSLVLYFRTWCERSTLYITKMFAETVGELPEEFKAFLDGFHGVAHKYSEYLPAHLLDSQMEVILGSSKWVSSEYVVRYVASVLLDSSKKINGSKILQIFVNNESNALKTLPTKENLQSRFYSSVIIFAIFRSNVSKLSSRDLQTKVVQLYLGSTRPEDLVLKQILNQIESKIAISWVDNVTSWDFLEDMSSAELDATGELPRLVTADKRGNLTVNINKTLINNAILGMEFTPGLPSDFTKWDDWMKFNESCNSLSDFENANSIYRSLKYDAEFMMLLSLNNEELVKIEEAGSVKFDLKNLASSGLLQLIVTNLANEDSRIRQVSEKLLRGVASSLEEEENEKDGAEMEVDATEDTKKTTGHKFQKDSAIFKVYLGNLLRLYGDSIQEDGKRIPSVVILMLSNLVSIIADPSHFLYEKVYHFLLAYPKFKAMELPLFKAIALQFSTDDKDSGIRDQEGYYRRLSWLLSTIKNSICSELDLKVLSRDAFMEWLLNLSASPYVASSLQLQIWGIVSKIQSLPGGSDWLIRGYAALLTLEAKYLEAEQTNCVSTNTAELAAQRVKASNYEKLVMRTGLTVVGNKRIREWTFDDVPKILKRAHSDEV